MSLREWWTATACVSTCFATSNLRRIPETFHQYFTWLQGKATVTLPHVIYLRYETKLPFKITIDEEGMLWEIGSPISIARRILVLCISIFLHCVAALGAPAVTYWYSSCVAFAGERL